MYIFYANMTKASAGVSLLTYCRVQLILCKDKASWTKIKIKGSFFPLKCVRQRFCQTTETATQHSRAQQTQKRHAADARPKGRLSHGKRQPLRGRKVTFCGSKGHLSRNGAQPTGTQHITKRQLQYAITPPEQPRSKVRQLRRQRPNAMPILHYHKKAPGLRHKFGQLF